MECELRKYMGKLNDKRVKKKYQVVLDLSHWLFKEPQPYLNLDQIDYLLLGDEEAKGLCHLCSLKSSVLKTIKRIAANAVQVLHGLLFTEEYFLREQVQDEFRGLEA